MIVNESETNGNFKFMDLGLQPGYFIACIYKNVHCHNIANYQYVTFESVLFTNVITFVNRKSCIFFINQARIGMNIPVI